MMSAPLAALSVSELNRQVRQLLEASFLRVRVTGEVSNFSCPASGHWYFTLKDANAQVRCAMFRNRNRLLRSRPKDGDSLTVDAMVSLYEGRGEFQLLIEGIEQAGEGALRRAYEALRLKLQAEGLFDPARKQPLPSLPSRIVVITSPTGAALRDILTVLGRRFPAIPVLLVPVPVQGAEAAPAIVRALHVVAESQLGDLIILGRGGGSLEDLWAFNEEAVVRAVAACPIAIISAVGHETDTTLCDFAADLRAPTPSAAAEKASPDQREWLQRLRLAERRLLTPLQRRLVAERRHLAQWRDRLERQPRTLEQHQLRLDDGEARLLRALRRYLDLRQRQLGASVARLKHPRVRLRENAQRAAVLKERLSAAVRCRVQGDRHTLRAWRERLLRLSSQVAQPATLRLQAIAGRLQAVSPLATLARGYSITTNAAGEVLVEASRAQIGDTLVTRLHAGRLVSRVTEVENANDENANDEDTRHVDTA